MVRGQKTKVPVISCPLLSRESDISGAAARDLITSGTNVDLDSRMNGSERGSQGASSLWAYETCFWKFFKDNDTIFSQMSRRVKTLSRLI